MLFGQMFVKKTRKFIFCFDFQVHKYIMFSSFWLLRVESRDFSQSEKERKKELLATLSKFTKWQPFSLKKRQSMTILGKNSYHFVNPRQLSFVGQKLDQTPRRIFKVSILTQGTWPLDVQKLRKAEKVHRRNKINYSK